MSREQRNEFLRAFFPGIVLLITLYVFLTIFRDVRDNFVADMWKEMGFFNQPDLFTKTETPITIITLILVGSLIVIKKNFRALMIIHGIVMAGFVVAGVSSALFVAGFLSPVTWVTSVGLGLYMGYIPYNCVLFDRLIAVFRIPANVGFLMYLADSFGYMGSVGVVLTKAILGAFNVNIRWTSFYSHGVIILSIIGVAGTIVSVVYFFSKNKQLNPEHA
jgi:hypothetical protein